MQLLILLLILLAFTVKYFAKAADLFDDETDIDSSLDGLFDSGSNIDLLDDNLWYIGSTNPTVADDGLFSDDTIASNACSSSSGNPLGRRRRSLLCPDKTNDIEVRPLGETKDAPLIPVQYNLQICSKFTMGTFRTRVACDSGRDADRFPTSDAGIFVLHRCTPCKGWCIPCYAFLHSWILASWYSQGVFHSSPSVVLHGYDPWDRSLRLGELNERHYSYFSLYWPSFQFNMELDISDRYVRSHPGVKCTRADRMNFSLIYWENLN